MPAITTIITPLKSASVEACRQYLRGNAEPQPDFANDRLQCQPLFAFDAIATLHFCSFVILDAEAEFGPSLVFEATFDGPRDDFLRELLRVAPEGLHALYQHCEEYPATGVVAPELLKEYFERHDVGANTFFSGYPGRSVAQVQGENNIHSGIVTFLSDRWRAARSLPGRLPGFFDAIRHDFIRGRPENRWAGEPAKLPWEMTSRALVAGLAIVALGVLACLVGIIPGAVLPSLRPSPLYDTVTHAINVAGQPGIDLISRIAAALPWIKDFIEALRPALPTLAGVTLLWLVVRAGELILSGLSKHPRDQSFYLRFPLQIAVILRYALMLFLAGSALLVLISGMEHAAPATSGSKLHDVMTGIVALLVAVVVLIGLQYAANSLKLEVELQPLGAKQEKWRRAKLDIVRYAMVLTCAVGLLAIARQTPLVLGHDLAEHLRSMLAIGFVLLTYGVVGLLAAYLIGFLLFLMIRALELRDAGNFADPAGLIQRAPINARKYVREEGGTNTFQNHLASLTYVKPGVLRWALLWLALAAVNLLSRFWFNRGELGGIPTILSARWVMIDRGRRLLFLDNYGGAWDSYLNEFIDLAAVKGLNAIWSSTFVHAVGQRFGFPATRFFFWEGAQAEQPFKAYVRQSQIETLVWYSAYPTLSVVNVNANTGLRQSLSAALAPHEIDAVFQRL
jgi:hypothetical protein